MNGKECIRQKNAYELIIGKLDNIKLFSSNIGFSIARKQRKLNDAIRIFDEFNNGSDRVDSWLKLYMKENNRWIKIGNHTNAY
jgi:hypothetical protein